jgi:molybdenum cofactor biosynthesis enzyme MoaA
MAIDRISLELSNACSKGCHFCYNASGRSAATVWQPGEVIDLARDCHANGDVKAISFGGGEPLEYAGVFDILRALRGAMFRSLTSNGLHLDAHLGELVDCAPDKVHVSIHFPGNTDEVARVIRQVDALQRAGIPGGINLLVRASQLASAEHVQFDGLSERRSSPSGCPCHSGSPGRAPSPG